jgi:hypothetical protein
MNTSLVKPHWQIMCQGVLLQSMLQGDVERGHPAPHGCVPRRRIHLPCSSAPETLGAAATPHTTTHCTPHAATTCVRTRLPAPLLEPTMQAGSTDEKDKKSVALARQPNAATL